VKNIPKEEGSAGVHKAKQAEEIYLRWQWVEQSVWTERMLTALENGVKGGKWFSVNDKVYRMENLLSSFERVKRNKGAAGVDHVSVERFESGLAEELQRIAEELRNGTYEPQAIKRVWIPKPGSHEKRPLGIPTVRDRVIQGAVRNTLEPIFEKDFAQGSFGFRPQRGCKDALREVQRLLEEGYKWVVDADLKSYFDSIPHEGLMQEVEKKITDGRMLKLIGQFLKQGVLETMKEWVPEEGTPQGAVISPLLSNIYLDPLDQEMAQANQMMVRYADDFVILCRTQSEAEAALTMVRQWCENAKLTLHPEKTRIVDATQQGGFDFLGYHFERGYKWPRKKSIKKLKDTIRKKTKRKNGNSLQVIIRDVNQTTKGWFEYFKHSHYTTFGRLDSWVRMRLRSILRKRSKRKGRGIGWDHIRWPNAYFVKHGLFSLTAARDLAAQSSRR
jgi:RNA-directed DNA polymerase